MLSRLTALVWLALLVCRPLAAQTAKGLELGGFLQWTAFDGSLRIDDFYATGGQVRLPLFGAIAVEGEASRTITNGPPGIRISYVPARARLVYTRPIQGRTTGHIGLGYVHNWYGESRDGSDGGLTALAGVRFALTARLGFRLDAIADYMPSPANAAVGANENWNLGVRQQLSIALGRRGAAEPVPVAETNVVSPRVTDTDGDGVGDDNDRCPGTPAGTPVDASGCALDSDRDGVPDRTDRCPDTPAGTAVDAMGCALDSDHDGVPDATDRCPNTPAGTAVDAMGCVLDADHDGVPDTLDRCPNTTAGSRVDASGCVILFEEHKTSLILEGVNFANGKAELTDESRSILDNVAASMAVHDSIRVSVDGHTSSTGTRALNLRLSAARAETVKQYLVARGIDPRRLLTRGFGPDRPIASNTTAEGQAKNRRTELTKLN
jgi:outer membrane protein OmpA-like peptidoglycan-associated protein